MIIGSISPKSAKIGSPSTQFSKPFKGAAFCSYKMVIMHNKSKQSPSGSKFVAAKKKRLNQMGSKPTHTKLGDAKLSKSSRRSKLQKVRVASSNIVNLSDKKSKKTFKAKIKAVLENPASRHFVRRSIITKGTIIDTDKGKAKVTSRPGQDGTINAVLV